MAPAEALVESSPESAVYWQAAAEVPEEYARSFRAARRYEAARQLAAVACGSEVISMAQESLELERQSDLDDEKHAVTEMLASDKDFDCFDIDLAKERLIINGRVRAVNKEAIVPMVERGAVHARKAADANPKMEFEYVRAEGDALVAKRSERLPVGWTLLAASMNPQEAIEQYPEIAQDKFGYTDVMYWQWYSHSSQDIMDTGTHSAALSDMEVWSGVAKDFINMDIPEGTTADEWIRHGVELECTPEQADQLVRDMRDEYYRRIGLSEKRYSVTEYVEQKSEVVEEIFDTYNPALAHAVVSGDNNETMSSLAATMLQTEAVKELEPQVRQDLLVVANSGKFDEKLGKTMRSILRYVMVEELRKGLPEFINGPTKSNQENQAGQVLATEPLRDARVPLEILNQRMASNFQSGIQEKRSYSGCSFQIKLTKEDEQGPKDALGNALGSSSSSSSRQSAYRGYGGGGRRAREALARSGKINCIKCKVAVDEREAKKVEGRLRCTSCKYEIEICSGKVKNQSQPRKTRGEQSKEKDSPRKAKIGRRLGSSATKASFERRSSGAHDEHRKQAAPSAA